MLLPQLNSSWLRKWGTDDKAWIILSQTNYRVHGLGPGYVDSAAPPAHTFLLE